MKKYYDCSQAFSCEFEREEWKKLTSPSPLPFRYFHINFSENLERLKRLGISFTKVENNYYKVETPP